MNPELQILAFPLSLIAAAIMFVVILLFPKKSFRLASLGVLALLAVGFAVLGCLKPDPKLVYWMVPAMLAAIFLCGVAARDAIRSRQNLSFTLSHLGLCVLLVSSVFAAPDCISTGIILEKDKPSQLTEDGVPLPFELTLREVGTEYHEGTQLPKQYRCTIDINSETRQISVNHPTLHKGWLLYLSDFDRQDGRRALLRAVRDPSIPGVLLGMVMLLAAAVLGLKRSWRSRLVLPALLILALVFTLVSVSRIRFGTLPPALRSFWFAPHLIVYMLAYAALALSIICSLAAFFPRFSKLGALARPLLESSSSLILMGIIFGSIWAQLSWGDYWAWDAKECWAAATYLLTLCATHLPPKHSRAAFLAAALLSFAAMQMTWYGVNLLPSAQSSMHTYNTK